MFFFFFFFFFANMWQMPKLLLVTLVCPEGTSVTHGFVGKFPVFIFIFKKKKKKACSRCYASRTFSDHLVFSKWKRIKTMEPIKNFFF